MSRVVTIIAVWFVAFAGAPLWAGSAALITLAPAATATAPGWAPLRPGAHVHGHAPRGTEHRDHTPAQRWADTIACELLDGNELPEPALPGLASPRLTSLGPARQAPRAAALPHGCAPLRRAPKTGPPPPRHPRL